MGLESSNRRLYPDRPGVKIEKALATLQRKPEVVLTPEAEREARQFEQDLTRGDLIDSQGQHVESLEPLWELKVNSATMLYGVFADIGRTSAMARAYWNNFGRRDHI